MLLARDSNSRKRGTLPSPHTIGYRIDISTHFHVVRAVINFPHHHHWHQHFFGSSYFRNCLFSVWPCPQAGVRGGSVGNLLRVQLIWFLFFYLFVFFVRVMIECLVCCSACPLSLYLFIAFPFSLFPRWVLARGHVLPCPAPLPCAKRIKYFEAG